MNETLLLYFAAMQPMAGLNIKNTNQKVKKTHIQLPK